MQYDVASRPMIATDSEPAAKSTRLRLTLLPLSLTNLGSETSLDTSDRTTRSARVAGNKVQPILSLVEVRVGRTTSFAGNVLDLGQSLAILRNKI